MLSQISEFVANMTEKDVRRTLVQALCDLNMNGGAMDIDELKDYVKIDYPKAERMQAKADDVEADEAASESED